MKKFYLLTAIIFISSSLASAQQGEWNNQSTPSQVYSLKSVFFIDDQHGWAVGLEAFTTPAVILFTENGGATWSKQDTEAMWSLNSVFFINATTGWAVGDYGTILHTTDAGSTWSELTLTLEGVASFQSVYFVNESTGWIIGGGQSDVPGYILKTTDGGINWIEQNSGLNGTVSLNSICFEDANTGWIAGSGNGGVILKTVNGGGTWSPQTSNTQETLTAIHFPNATNGWAVGYSGTIMYSNDGGSSWTPQSSGHDGFIDGVFFTSATTGWVVGSGGTILHTTNGGNEWTSTSVGGFSTRLYDLHFTAENTGWAVGSSSSGEIYKYTDDGSTSIKEQTLIINSTAYPNPFTHSTTLEFSLNQSEKVLLEIYDLPGKRIQTLVDAQLGAHSHYYTFDGEALPAGAYVYRLQVGEHVESGKLILSK